MTRQPKVGKPRREKGTWTAMDNVDILDSIHESTCTGGIMLILRSRKNYDRPGATFPDFQVLTEAADITILHAIKTLTDSGRIHRTGGVYQLGPDPEATAQPVSEPASELTLEPTRVLTSVPKSTEATCKNTVQHDELDSLKEVEGSLKEVEVKTYPHPSVVLRASVKTGEGLETSKPELPSPSAEIFTPARIEFSAPVQAQAPSEILRGAAALSPAARNMYRSTNSCHDEQADAARALLQADPLLLNRLAAIPGTGFGARCIITAEAVNDLDAPTVAGMLLEAKAGGDKPWGLFEFKVRQERAKRARKAEMTPEYPEGELGVADGQTGVFRSLRGNVVQVIQNVRDALDVLSNGQASFMDRRETAGWVFLGVDAPAGTVNA